MNDYLKQAAFALIFCIYLLPIVMLLDSYYAQDGSNTLMFVIAIQSGIIAAASLYLTVKSFRLLHQALIKRVKNALDQIEP